MTRVKPIHKDFELLADRIRQDFADNMGMDINFTQATQVISNIVEGIDFGFSLERTPRKKVKSFKIKIRKKKK